MTDKYAIHTGDKIDYNTLFTKIRYILMSQKKSDLSHIPSKPCNKDVKNRFFGGANYPWVGPTPGCSVLNCTAVEGRRWQGNIVKHLLKRQSESQSSVV